MKECLYCAEEIQDAAIVCKHCGRKQTKRITSTEKRFAVVGTIVLVFVLIVVSAVSDQQARNDRIERAARCSHTVSADQIRQAAELSASQNNISVREAENIAIGYACPSMAN